MCFDGMSPCRDSGQIPDRTEMTGCARNGHFHRTRASQRAQLESIIPKALREGILRSAVESANSDTKEAANWGTPNEFATISRFAVNWLTVGRLFPRCWRLEWAAPVQPLAPRCWGRFSPAHAKMKRPPTEAACTPSSLIARAEYPRGRARQFVRSRFFFLATISAIGSFRSPRPILCNPCSQAVVKQQISSGPHLHVCSKR